MYTEELLNTLFPGKKAVLIIEDEERLRVTATKMSSSEIIGMIEAARIASRVEFSRKLVKLPEEKQCQKCGYDMTGQTDCMSCNSPVKQEDVR